MTTKTTFFASIALATVLFVPVLSSPASAGRGAAGERQAAYMAQHPEQFGGTAKPAAKVKCQTKKNPKNFVTDCVVK